MIYNVFSGTLNPTHFTSLHLCAGQVLDEEWRLVVRRDSVGGARSRPRAAVRAARRRAGDWQLSSLLRGAGGRSHRRGARAAAAAARMSARDLRPDVRVLAARRLAAADVPRDTHVPSAQEHGLLATRRRPSVGRHLLCLIPPPAIITVVSEGPGMHSYIAPSI